MAKMACAKCGGAKRMQDGGTASKKAVRQGMREVKKADRADKKYMSKYEKQKAEELMKSKRFANGGIAGIDGMPKYGNNPRTQEGRMLRKGGLAKADSGMQVRPMIPSSGKADITKVSKVQKKYAEGGSTENFAPNRAVMDSCKNGMVRNYDGRCVMERMMQMGGAMSKTRKTISGGTRTKMTSGDNVNITRRNKAGEITKQKTRKAVKGWSEDEYKVGGATKAAKFAALAPPYNKATAADRIAGAKKNARKK